MLRSLPLVAGLLLLPTLLPAQQLTSAAQYYRLRQQADSIFHSANLSAAEPLLKRLLDYDARDGEIWYAYARTLQNGDKRAQAIQAYRRVIELGFGYPGDHYFAIARLYAQAGERDSTTVYAQRALGARYAYRDRLRTESVFQPFHDHPPFRALAAVPDSNLTRDARWQFDLAYLVAEAKRLHASFERQAYAPAFDSAAAALRRDIPRLDDEAIVARMRALVVLLDDGHTGVYFENAHRLPITMYWFKDGVFVIRDVSGAREPASPGDTTLLGSRVIAIEGVPVEQAMQRVAAFIARDNDMGVRAIAPGYLVNRPILRAAGILRDSTQVTLTVRNRKGATRRVRMPFMLPNDVTPKLNVLPGDSASRPLWLLHARQAYWVRPLPEAEAVYLQFNAVRHDPTNPIPTFARQLTQLLDSTKARHLIVDLRHNGGGNSYLFPPLIKAMIVFREKSPEHQVYVITGRQTFSAAQNFATAIDQWVGAIFVGEPTGSRTNFTGESSTFRLPASNTRANISWRWHQYAQWVDHRKWIAPQIPAEATSQDYFSGRDPALEAILEVIRGD
ncbi:MAG TPA: hypothetical protein VFO52_03255 [Longimicrobiales bacterium]|nr:hypothetical protein [Longimicrobiales bacterium]